MTVVVARFERGLPPADLVHDSRVLAVRDPVAFFNRTVELERESGHDVSERVLEGPPDDRRENRGRRHEADHLDVVDRQDEEEGGHAARRDDEIPEDSRRRDPDEGQEDAEEGRSGEGHDGQCGDELPRDVDRPRGRGEARSADYARRPSRSLPGGHILRSACPKSAAGARPRARG
jgi:hypothetical protein